MPYQVFGDNSGAVAVTVTCTRSASARSCGAISAMLSRTACRPSAFLAPFLPSARNSAARFFIAARSAALKPPDSVLALVAGIASLPSLTLKGSVSYRPSTRKARARPHRDASRFLTGSGLPETLEQPPLHLPNVPICRGQGPPAGHR